MWWAETSGIPYCTVWCVGVAWQQECSRHAPLDSLRQRTHAYKALVVHDLTTNIIHTKTHTHMQYALCICRPTHTHTHKYTHSFTHCSLTEDILRVCCLTSYEGSLQFCLMGNTADLLHQVELISTQRYSVIITYNISYHPFLVRQFDASEINITMFQLKRHIIICISILKRDQAT